MSKTKNFIHWFTAIACIALGVALSTKANFGLSMVSAPAYILHVVLRELLAWYTQGTSEYALQAVLLVLMCFAVGGFRAKYLLSFGTAVLFGLLLDGWFLLFGGNAAATELAVRIPLYIAGTLSCSLGVSFVFRTTLPPQIYELVVVEFSEHFSVPNAKMKFYFDMTMLMFSLLLSLLLTRSFTGIGIGTVITTFVNAPLIGVFGKLIDRWNL